MKGSAERLQRRAARGAIAPPATAPNPSATAHHSASHTPDPLHATRRDSHSHPPKWARRRGPSLVVSLIGILTFFLGLHVLLVYRSVVDTPAFTTAPPLHTVAQPQTTIPVNNVTVSLVLPLIADIGHSDDTNANESTLLTQVFGPLFSQEAALCEGAAEAGVRGVEAVVVSDAVGADADAVQRVVGRLLAPGSAKEGTAVADGGAGGALTAGDAWRAWELRTAAVRVVLAAAGVGAGVGAAGDSDAAAGCLGERVTVVAAAVGDGGGGGGGGVERLVDAGLRTRGGRAGSHFVVVSSFVGATRMAHTVPGDAAEARREGRGLLAALVATATQRNGGRVAAAQCTLLQRHRGAPRLTLPWPPAVLGAADLAALEVVDKGALTGSTHNRGMLQPYVARRLSGYGAADQRASWEDVVDAASLHCGIFARGVYDGVGGLAGALAGGAVRDAVSARPEHAMGSCDRGGWALTLRMQAVYPAWQVWCSGATAALRDGVAGVRKLAAVASLQRASFSLLDAYGVSVYDVVTALQRRRVGVPWRRRGEVAVVLNSSAGMLQSLTSPPIVVYSTDFPCSCCGLSREAMGYIRPLMERYALHVVGDRRSCSKAGDVLLRLAYGSVSHAMWAGSTRDTRVLFFSAKYSERAQVHFQHRRAPSYGTRRSWESSRTPVISIGRSLSELSNVKANWVKPLAKRVDEVWATADFFATIYKRNGISANRIRVVPEAVDVYELDPANFARLPMLPSCVRTQVCDNRPNLTDAERLQRYVFFSNFKWEDRKGWDVLLKAYWAAFGPSAPPELRERTTLVMKISTIRKYAKNMSDASPIDWIAAWGARGNLPGWTSERDLPHIVAIRRSVDEKGMAQMYANADAFVYPTKAEGWGLPAVEAMSMGLPVLVTEWSGVLGFMAPDTCFRIPLDGLEEIPKDSPYGYAEGMKYAVPSWEKTAELMRYVVQHPEHARRVGRRAREYAVRELSEEAVADMMDREFLDGLSRKQASEGFTLGGLHGTVGEHLW